MTAEVRKTKEYQEAHDALVARASGEVSEEVVAEEAGDGAFEVDESVTVSDEEAAASAETDEPEIFE